MEARVGGTGAGDESVEAKEVLENDELIAQTKLATEDLVVVTALEAANEVVVNLKGLEDTAPGESNPQGTDHKI